MSHLTETVDYTPRNDWGALPWGSVCRMRWGDPEKAEAQKVADWVAGKGPLCLSILDGKVLLRGQVRIPDPIADMVAAMARVKAVTGYTPNVLYVGGKRLVDPTMEQAVMAFTGCAKAEAQQHMDAAGIVGFDAPTIKNEDAPDSAVGLELQWRNADLLPSQPPIAESTGRQPAKG